MTTYREDSYFRIRNRMVPCLGLGTTVFWNGSYQAEKAMERALGHQFIHMIDCAEMYGYGRCEKTAGRILHQVSRKNVFVIDKILPENAVPGRFAESFEASCRRLGTDYIDLYLLHWREDADLSFVAEEMEALKRKGRIGEWGVSNFDVKDMDDLFAVPMGNQCFCDQIMYNLGERGIEYDLLPWLENHDVLPMAYSPLGSGWSSIRTQIRRDAWVKQITEKLHVSPEAFMLAFVLHQNVSAVFSSSSDEHILANRKALEIDIEPYMDELNRRWPAPDHKVPLAKL